MAIKYVDNLNASALDDVTYGSAALPYLTIAYALSQAFSGDTIMVGNATTYTLAATNLNVTKSIYFTNWNNRTGAKPKIDGGDATRVIFINTANPVIFDGFIFESTRVGVSSYIFESRPATRNLIVRNSDFIGATGLGAFGTNAGSSGTSIENTCTFTMTGGAIVYASATGSISCTPSTISLSGSAQAVFFINNGASAGTQFTFGGAITLTTIDNYIYRCGTTNEDAAHIIHSSFNVVSVPANFSKTSIEILNPRSVVIQDGAIIDTRKTTLVSAGEVWIRSSKGDTIPGTINIGNLIILSASLSGYGLKIGDESPFSTSHKPNSYTSLIIDGVYIRGGVFYGTPGTTQTHVLFIGNENQHIIRNCDLEGGAYGIGIKGDNTCDTTSYIYNNKVKGMRLAHLKTKGMRRSQWFNNLIIEDSKGGIGLDLTKNTDDGTEGLGNASIGINNTFVMNTAAALNIDTESDLGDNNLDYNSYYTQPFVAMAILSSFGYVELSNLQTSELINIHSVHNQGYPNLEADYKPKVKSIEYRSGISVNELVPYYVKSHMTNVSNATLASNTKIKVDCPGRRRIVTS